MSKRGKRQHRAAKRRAALRDAADATAVTRVTTSAPPPPPTPTSPTLAPSVAVADRRRPAVPWPILGAAAAVGIAIAILMAFGFRGLSEPSAQVASPTIEVGVPSGVVISQASRTPTSSATPVASETPAQTQQATPAPVAVASPPPTPLVTPPPEPTAEPTTAPPPPAPSPAPTAIVVAVAQPDDSVASFYRNAAAGNFDAAYALWSDGMKATYPRQENLDGRFLQTAGIEFTQLSVVEQTERTATVQADFVETYDGGGSREFIGYWRLVLVDGRWLLDEPNY